MKFYIILESISVTLLIGLSIVTSVFGLNSTILVSVDVTGVHPANITTSIYDGKNRSEKTEVISPNSQNDTHLFEFYVKNVSVSTEKERQYEDEDEDSEFRVCSYVDKNKNNYKKVVCENILVTDTRENITLDLR